MSQASILSRHAVLYDVELSDIDYHSLINVQPLARLLTSFCTSHLILRAQSLLPTLIRHPRMSSDQVFHAVSSLMSTEIAFKSFILNDHWSAFMKSFFLSACLKYEIMSDFHATLIGNGFYKECKNEYNAVWAKRSKTYITIEIYDHICKACVALCDYMVCVDEMNNSYEPTQSSEMALMQIQNIWTALLAKTSSALDFIIPRVLEICIHRNEIQEARECLITYRDFNSDHLNAHIYLFKFLVAYDKDYEGIEELINDCFYKVVELSPCSLLILEILEYQKDYQSTIRDYFICLTLMEFVDYTNNKNNSKAWEQLYLHLQRLNPVDVFSIKQHYRANLQSYWPEYHFPSNEEGISEWKEKVRDFLEQKINYAKNFKEMAKKAYKQSLNRPLKKI